MSIVLIGYRGSGKTTIGRKLADRLWQPFVDIDELIVEQGRQDHQGNLRSRTASRTFRDLEAEVVRGSQPADGPRDRPGRRGARTRGKSRSAIQTAGHKVIYLRCEPAELLERIQADPQSGRHAPEPDRLGGGIEEIAAMLAEREPIYRSAMTARNWT